MKEFIYHQLTLRNITIGARFVINVERAGYIKRADGMWVGNFNIEAAKTEMFALKNDGYEFCKRGMSIDVQDIMTKYIA